MERKVKSKTEVLDGGPGILKLEKYLPMEAWRKEQRPHISVTANSGG